MSEKIPIKATTAKGEVLAEFEIELPTEFDELEVLPGKEKSLSFVRNQMKVNARTKYKPSKGKPSVIPKSDQKELRAAILAGDLSTEELMAFIKAKREGK
jgi:hypothetical protein